MSLPEKRLCAWQEFIVAYCIKDLLGSSVRRLDHFLLAQL